jgi:hypothetical protein
MPATRGRRFGAIVLAAAVVFAACGGGDDDEVGTDDTSSSSGSSSTSDPGSSSTEPTAPAVLPGEPTDFGPQAGGIVAVVGVAFDDELNVRTAPGVSNPVVATLAPTATTDATGNNRFLGRSIWYEIDAGGTTGWANGAFLLGLGSTEDITSRVISQLGSRPSAETMLDLGRIVADTQASTDVESDIVVVVAPTVGDLGEVTYDVIGLADDAGGGFRLHVFGQPEPSGEGFSLKSVEATDLCSRSFATPGSLCA